MMGEAAASKEVANGESRRLSAYNKSSNSTDAQAGNSVLLYVAPGRQGAPRWRGSAKVIGIDDAGVTVKFQSQTFKAARYCVRKKEDVQVAGAVDWNRAPGWSDT